MRRRIPEPLWQVSATFVTSSTWMVCAVLALADCPAAPALAGPFFYEKWNGRPLEELFRYGAENMPPEGMKLSESQYLDVTAYVLEVLKYPAGTKDLSADSPAMNGWNIPEGTTW